jgi:hypothetical protein
MTTSYNDFLSLSIAGGYAGNRLLSNTSALLALTALGHLRSVSAWDDLDEIPGLLTDKIDRAVFELMRDVSMPNSYLSYYLVGCLSSLMSDAQYTQIVFGDECGGDDFSGATTWSIDFNNVDTAGFNGIRLIIYTPQTERTAGLPVILPAGVSSLPTKTNINNNQAFSNSASQMSMISPYLGVNASAMTVLDIPNFFISDMWTWYSRSSRNSINGGTDLYYATWGHTDTPIASDELIMYTRNGSQGWRSASWVQVLGI